MKKLLGVVATTFALAIAVLVLNFTPTFAGELSGEFKAPKIGTTFKWSDGGQLTITEVKGLAVFGENATGKPLYSYGRIIPSPHYRFDQSKVDGLWPLKVGKSVTIDTSGTTGDGRSASWDFIVQVLQIETVTVPTGTYDTFVIEIVQKGTSGGGKGYTGKTTSWYAPSVGVGVKFTFEVLEGRNYGQKNSGELIFVGSAAKTAEAPK